MVNFFRTKSQIHFVLLLSLAFILFQTQLIFYQHFPINFNEGNNIIINNQQSIESNYDISNSITTSKNTNPIKHMSCAIGIPPWKNNNFTKEIIKFKKIWKNNPDKINHDGTSFSHYFAVSNIIHSLKPTHIIESGAHHGANTWFLRQVAPNSVKLIVISPQTPELYLDTHAIYYSGDIFKDFNIIHWKNIVDVKNTIIFFDDHQTAIRRMKQAQEQGFQHIVFDDNYLSDSRSNLSPQQLCTPYLSDFINKTAEIYAEFPPVQLELNRFHNDAKTWRNEIENMGLDFEGERHAHIEYIKLKSYLVSLGNEKANTIWTVHSKCLQYKLDENQRIIVYGVGAGEDISWDIQMIETFNVESYIFDPTPKSIHTITPIINTFNIKYKQLPNITFIHEGLSNKEGIINFELPKNNKAVSMKEMPNNIENKNNKNMISAKVNTLQNWMKRF
eukprot:514992_1